MVENGHRVLANLVSSQINIHRRFGGVVPEVASRKHIEVIASLVDEALKEAGMTGREIDAIAVTYTPGLIGALLVGVSFAKAYAYGLGKPLIGVDHLEAHIYANFLRRNSLVFPAVCLASLWWTHQPSLYERSRCFELLGRTRDDAAGEAFDKVARFLGLGLEGHCAQKAAQSGKAGIYHLPRFTKSAVITSSASVVLNRNHKPMGIN